MQNIKDLLTKYRTANSESEREAIYKELKVYYSDEAKTVEQVFREQNNLDELDKIVKKGKVTITVGFGIVIAMIVIVVAAFLYIQAGDVKVVDEKHFSALGYFIGFGCLLAGTFLASVQRMIRI